MSRPTVFAPLPALVERARTDPSRPLVTYVDLAEDTRSELSAAALATWVAKTSQWLELGLGVMPGDRVWLNLPAHWQASVWCLASWAVGGVVVLGTAEAVRAGGGAAVAAVGSPDGYPSAAAVAGEVAAVDLRPFALGISDLPSGVLDHSSEARGYGDVLAPAPRPTDTTALVTPRGPATLDELAAAAQARVSEAGLQAGARLLVTVETVPGEAQLDRWVRDGVLLPLLLGGSVVLCRGGSLQQQDRLARVEHATAC